MAELADFTEYPKKDLEALIYQLTIVVSELYNAHIIVGSTMQQEKTARVRGFMASEETTISGRERDAEAQALPLTMGLYEMQAQIKALTEERELLLLLIGERRARQDRPVDHTEGLPAGYQSPNNSQHSHPSAL